MKSIFVSVAAAAIAIAAPANADMYTYDVNFGSPSSLITGTMVTDCNDCALEAVNITSWSLTANFSPAGTITVTSSQSSPHIFLFSPELIATPAGIFFDFSESSSSAVYEFFASGGNIGFFNASADNSSFGIGSYYACVNPEGSNCNQIFTTGNLQIATAAVSSVPGPIVGAGLPGLVAALGLIGWRRRRQKNA